jgi:2-C-methyl-D-erythritol 4-phosphate cytidylyltransferase
MHSITAFYSTIPNVQIIVALPEEHFGMWADLCKEYNFTVPHKVSKGGETRFHSVKNSLEYIDEKGLVAVHDGVRPLLTKELIDRAFEEASLYGNAIPAVSVNDSVRLLDNDTYIRLDRNHVKVIQTPQCFSSSVLKQAYHQNYKDSFTDDATVVESFGEKIHLIEGEPGNIKITKEVDLIFAESLIKH